MKIGYFEVDKEGLAKLLANRGKEFILYELVQNAWDQNVTNVSISVEKVPNRPLVTVRVEDDDPDGFTDLSHAYTLFAESEKKSNPEQRGRFNLGEKLVLALCKSATITTTKGTVEFTEDGERKRKRNVTTSGSSISMDIKANKQDYDDMVKAVYSLIPPAGIKTYFDGIQLPEKEPLVTFEATLPTVISDSDGALRNTRRKTTISIHRPAMHVETAHLYEMGIPVVEMDTFHVNVQQKVPLNMDRDNVTPAYKRELRALVLAHTFKELDSEEASEPWVDDAIGHKVMFDHPDAVKEVVVKRYGTRCAITDPSDRAAENELKSKDYTIIPGRAFSKGAWAVIRDSNAAVPAGRINPSGFGSGSGSGSGSGFSSTGPSVTELSTNLLTHGMRKVSGLTTEVANVLTGMQPKGVRFIKSSSSPQVHWGNDVMVYNISRLGKKWFDKDAGTVIGVILRSIAHEVSSDPLSHEYVKEIARLGALLAVKLAGDENLQQLIDKY